MAPKIDFVWSFVYQELIHSPTVKSEKYDFKVYEGYTKKFMGEISKEWKKLEKPVLNYIEELTGLKWKRKEIDCFVIKISAYGPISYPLTIPIQLEVGNQVYTLTKERFIDMLIHELIHCFFIDNEKETSKYFDNIITGKFKNEQFNTKIHIPVHAIHKKILLKFFGIERLNNEIKMSGYYPEYKRAWEIVQKETEDKIIEEMKNYL